MRFILTHLIKKEKIHIKKQIRLNVNIYVYVHLHRF